MNRLAILRFKEGTSVHVWITQNKNPLLKRKRKLQTHEKFIRHTLATEKHSSDGPKYEYLNYK